MTEYAYHTTYRSRIRYGGSCFDGLNNRILGIVIRPSIELGNIKKAKW